MAQSLNFLTVLVVLLLVSSSFFVTKARPLNAAKPRGRGFAGEAIGNILEGLYIEAIKTGGPSGGGDGNDFTNAQTLGGVKNSGPSPGDGHQFTNVHTLGGVKNSYPSPGEGHQFTNGQTLGGVKTSGPSHGGKAHEFAHEAPSVLEEIKHSGPSPGQGN